MIKRLEYLKSSLQMDSYLFVETMAFFQPEGVVNGKWQINNGAESAKYQSKSHTLYYFTVSW